MAARKTIAQAIMDGDEAAVDRAAAGILKPLSSNFVERPWGGVRMRGYKGLAPLPDQPSVSGSGLGEAFELAAYDADDEAREHPSKLRFEDGSELELPALLRRHAARFLGRELAERHGGAFPLLPKTLDVIELLSVQGHPEGHTEVYVIIDADPGATLRVGFRRDVEPDQLAAKLIAGREQQQRLLELIDDRASPAALQALLAPWLAGRGAGLAAVPPELAAMLGGPAEESAVPPSAALLLEQLKALYWDVLDSMNAIEVEPGMVIYNANPPRIAAAAGRAPSAEVHALGNPEGREILALEIRRPGPTFRAWDNVRFPLRPIDIDVALRALNLQRVGPEELIVTPRPVPARAGVYRSVNDPAFTVEHLRPRSSVPVDVPGEGAHGLHCIAGRVVLHGGGERPLGVLRRGESALVPVGVGAYSVSSDSVSPVAEVVKAGPA